MRNRIRKVISKISILLWCLLGYYFLNKRYQISVICIFYKLTGLQCPGCGITRCLFSIIEGDLKKAFSYNSLVTILLGPFSIFMGINIYKYIKNGYLIKVSNAVWEVILIIVILFGIIRNII